MMKNIVMFNLIQFVIDNNIKEVDHHQAFWDERHIKSLIRGSYPFEKPSQHLIWPKLINNLKLDKITIHLLENFSDAIEKEDFVVAAVMQREIYNGWKFGLTENELFEKGSEYISSLKKGISLSKFFHNLLDEVVEIELIWKQEGFSKINFVIDRLLKISNIIHSHEIDDFRLEVVDFMQNLKCSHPKLLIDDLIAYFNVLKKRE